MRSIKLCRSCWDRELKAYFRRMLSESPVQLVIGQDEQGSSVLEGLNRVNDPENRFEPKTYLSVIAGPGFERFRTSKAKRQTG